jgi:6-pyruvoyl-tetrahydropterin synthase-like protein
VLLPLALLGFERGRDGEARWLALGAAALVALPLTGQLHLALGAVPFVLLYGVVRRRASAAVRAVVAAGAAAALAGIAVQVAVVHGSIADGGRSLDEVAAFSADWSGLFSRHVGPLEEFVLLGWAMPLLALVGLAALLLQRSRALPALLAAGVVVPALLALGTNLPLYEPLWHGLPPLRYPRVPERLLPIACLALAALAAIAVDQLRGRAVAVAALILVAVDLRAGVSLYRPAAADDDNHAYAALGEQGPGRLLELPVFIPERQYGSVYLYYAMQAPRERPGGYSTVAPGAADRVARELVSLNCGAWSARLERRLGALGVRYISLHRGLYADPAVPDCAARAARALRRHGFQRLASDGPVTLYGVAR